MKILNIALQSLYLHSTTVGAIAGGTSAGINVTSTVDVRVRANGVEKGFICTGSKKSYNEKLTAFTFFLLDNKPGYLAEDHRTQLQNLDRIDKRNAAVQGGRNKCERIRNYMKGSLAKIQPMRDGQHHNSPINIDGKGAICYAVVRDFMETKTNVVAC